MLQLKRIRLQRGAKNLLEDASVSLPAECICGLIGRNGTGKSSLMSVLQGQLQLDGGEFDIPPSWKLAYLEQELPTEEMPVLDFVCLGDMEWVAIQATLHAAEESEDGFVIAECHAALAAIDAYTLPSRAATMLHGLGFQQEDLTRSIQDFSGGWQMRMQLARVLLSRADCVLLDEPTNHLDFESIIYLENWLSDFHGCSIIISHDRDFLDRVTTHTLYLAQQKLSLYVGNYTSFQRQFQEKLLLQSKMAVKIQQKRAHMQSFVDRFRAKASKAKQAQGRLKALEKLQFSADLADESAFHFNFFHCDTLGYPALAVRGSMGYENKVILPNVDWSLDGAARIGLLGVNGAGKTTFLKSITGNLPLLRGELFVQKQAKIGYYAQQQVDSLYLDATPIAEFKRYYPEISESDARSMLGRFAFSHDRIFEKIKIFSGGEKARLALALLVYAKPNILILDEPTNHLDIQMREALIMALQSYQGAVIIVSHDRHLLRSCADEYYLVHDGKVEPYRDDLDAYQEFILNSFTNKKTVKKNDDKKNDKNEDKIVKDNPANNKKVIAIERDIKKLEEQIAKIDADLADGNIYQSENAEKLKRLQELRVKTCAKLADRQEQWLRLAD
jgi:ATP-binding cassette subfamily F protein 3